MRVRAIAATLVGLVMSAFVVLGVGSAAWAGGEGAAGSQPTLAETGYDFTPMLITAAVVLVVSGAAVLVAKYALARSSHS